MFCSSTEEDLWCYFRVQNSDGSQSWCLDEDCYKYLDVVSIDDNHCETNFLSLRFSSYSTYFTFLRSTSTKKSLSSYFSRKQTNAERLLQIEFLSSLKDDQIFHLNELKLLSNSTPSNIDTYELVFPGNLIENDSPMIFDEQIFLSEQQQYIDTIRLIFNCSANERVEWELVKSIQSVSYSPCPQQIRLKQENNHDQIYVIILTSCIAFFSVIIIGIIGLILFHTFYVKNNQRLISVSSISLIERF
ncbi:unnamed protein product [Adineta ricciae]|uniref:Uncharacterized protein n=1 Tax=Adineta ricciae TaxID=249248 RepID=A0A815MND1_ADIRI|nr:unnamed protein product [Adineta ricciae]CAF1425331.1 unnamed protein product [Adineta ricciae]